MQLFSEYLVRLMKYVEFMKKVVPLHDDLFDFFYQALPGYEKVGQRRVLLGCWGSWNDPEHCDYTYQNMNRWGEAMYVTPGVVVDGKLVTTNLVDINLGIRILLGSSFYDDWQSQETFVRQDPLGNPVDQRHPWNQTTTPRPQKRNFGDKYTWVMSPRWHHRETGDYLALDTGGGPLARLWSTALAGKVDIGYIKATGNSVKIYLPKTRHAGRNGIRMEDPEVEQRHRARPRPHVLPGLRGRRGAVLRREGDWRKCTPAGPRPGPTSRCREEAIGCGFHEAVRGVLSHHVVIRDGQDRQLPSLSADAVERQPARLLRHRRAL